MKTHPVRAELFHANGQTDRHDEPNSCFLQLCGCAWMIKPTQLGLMNRDYLNPVTPSRVGFILCLCCMTEDKPDSETLCC